MAMDRITVGIPAFNEERSIGRSIGSALASVPRVLEVIVVASGCTDGTANVVKGMMRRDKRVRLIEERERKGKGSAINLILRRARGGMIVMTDADLTFPPNSIPALLKKMDSRTGAVSGRPEYFARSPMFAWWGKFASECASVHRMAAEKKGFHDISGYLYAVRKGAINGVPPSAKSEDAFVGEIVRRKGLRIGYAPRAIVRVGYAENYVDYLRQKIRTHFGHLEVFRERGSGNAVESARMAAGMRGELKEYFRVANGMVSTPAEFAFFCLYLFTEVLVWFAAFLKYYFRGEEEWKQIRSTKK